METKIIASTLAQNNFGRILDDVVQNHCRYVINRRNASQAILLSLTDFEALLSDKLEHQKISKMLHELSPSYELGTPFYSVDQD